MFSGADQSFRVLNPDMEQIDGIESEPALGDQDVQMEISNQLSPHFQESFERAEHKMDLTPHPFLGKLEQCPDSIEEPGVEVDRLILYQTVEENSIEPVSLMENASGEFLQGSDIAENSGEDGSDLADQVDEISEGGVDHIPLVQPCNEMAEKALEQSDSKPNEVDLDSIYSEYTQPSCPSASLSFPAIPSKSGVVIRDNTGVKTEASIDQENFKGTVEDFRNRALPVSFGQDSKHYLLEQNETKIALDLSDTKPSDLKYALLPDNGGETKPTHLELPIKVEETKTEAAEEALPIYPDSSEVKHEKFFAYSVKSEDLVTKSEQLDLKQEILETKPEDLSLPIKPECMDSKSEILHLAVYSDVKPESKPLVLGTETKPEGLRLTGFPDASAVKPEAKPQQLEFTAYPDSSEIKPEAKPEGADFTALPEIKVETEQEMLEADSTVLTPKLEQADTLVETSGSLGVKDQVKEERPNSPG